MKNKKMEDGWDTELIKRVKEYAKKHKYSANRSFIPTSKGVVIASLPYHAKSKECFVRWTYREKNENGMAQEHEGFKKISLSRAKKERCSIIRCKYCGEPATRLDHLYPYHDEMNSCAKHEHSWREIKAINWIAFRDHCFHRANGCYDKGCSYLSVFEKETKRCCMENCMPWNDLPKA